MTDAEYLLVDKMHFFEAEDRFREALVALDALPPTDEQYARRDVVRAFALSRLASSVLQRGCALEAMDMTADTLELACEPAARARGVLRARPNADGALLDIVRCRLMARSVAGVAFAAAPELCQAREVGHEPLDTASSPLRPLTPPPPPSPFPNDPRRRARWWTRSAVRKA